MKINLLAAGAFAAALLMPLGAHAQQQDQGAPSRAYGNRTTPSAGRMQRNWARRFGNLNLSGDQQQHIQSLINDYSQSHPAGSPRDRASNRQLRRQIMGVLSDDQRNQFHQQMRARRAQLQQRQMQQGPENQGYQQAPDDQRYQQGPDGQGYQQGPPDQQGPPGQGPPGQQGPPYQQGGPDQQGPPYQQGPPEQQPPGPPPAQR